jgi:hypothetical protein
MKTHRLTTKIRAKKPENVCNCEGWVKARLRHGRTSSRFSSPYFLYFNCMAPVFKIPPTIAYWPAACPVIFRRPSASGSDLS